jgi:hypothetical protein
MVELIEYFLVFGLTVSLSAFSVLVFDGAIPVLDQNQAKAQMDEIAGAANLAALKGNASVVLPLSDASLACSQGVIHFSSGTASYSSQTGYPCDFQLTGVSCLCTLVFTQSQDGVELKVAG